MQSKHYRASIFAKESRRKMEMQLRRPWDALPSAALVNVFCRIPIRDRFHNLSLVCKSWADACCHSQCWASMVADSHYYSKSSAVDDYAFVKDYYPFTRFFPDPFNGFRSSDPSCGVHRLQALFGRAAGGAAVISLYFFPFLTSISGFPNDDALLHLIAQSCPNLRHLSFHGSFNATEEAILEVICTCQKLELVDFSDSPYFTPKVLERLGGCCPNLRGIRRNGILEPSTITVPMTSFPNLRMLNLSNSTIVDKDLLNIVTGRTGLQYLDITNCQQLSFYMYIIKGALSRIAEIIYD